MNTIISRTTPEPNVIAGEMPWFQIFEKDSYDTADVFFKSMDDLKAFSDSLSKQVDNLIAK